MTDKQKHQGRIVPEGQETGTPRFLPRQEADGLTGDAKILFEAYKELSKGGVTKQEAQQLDKIDEVLKDANIQRQKNGGAIITDNTGKSTFIR